jgi:hypothetical protein
MMPPLISNQAPVPPPAYHRMQVRLGSNLHIDTLTLVTTMHLLTLCRLAVRLAHRRCPPKLPAGLIIDGAPILAWRRTDLIRSPKRVLAHTWEGLTMG